MKEQENVKKKKQQIKQFKNLSLYMKMSTLNQVQKIPQLGIFENATANIPFNGEMRY